MNRVYKVIWSKAKHCYVVTSEIARSVTKSASSARSAGRKGAAVLAMAALLFTAGGVLGEAANVTGITVNEPGNVITVTKDDGKAPDTITINNVDNAKAADYAIKATSDGSGHVIENTYVKNVDARVGADGEYVKKDKTVGENLSALDTNLSALDTQVKKNTEAVVEVGKTADKTFTDLYAKVQTNAQAVADEETARKQADQNNLKIEGDDGVISKVTGNDGTKSSAVNKLVLNKDDKNQITLSGDGIKVGLNSGVMDKDGFYAGGDDYEHAGAALKWDGSIKGANGDFTVDTKGNADIGGDLTVDKNLTVNGTFDSKTLSSTVDAKDDYTTINGGNVTSEVNDKVGTVDYSAESIFNKDGSSITVRTNEGIVDSTGKSIVGAKEIRQYLGDNAKPDGSQKNVTRKMVRNDDGTFSMEDKAVDGKNKYSTVSQNAGERKVTVIDGNNKASTNLSNNGFNTFASDGTNKTYTKQTATDIKNTAEKGMISHTAKNLVNNASENMTNTVGKDLTTTVGGNETRTVEGTLKETVTGDVTEDYKANLSTKVGGNQSIEVTGDQSNTVGGALNETVTGKVVEDYKDDMSTKVGGNQSIEVTGNQENTVGGTLTETVTGDVTEDYKANLDTTVTGDSSLSAENINNKATKALTNEAETITNKAHVSVTTQIGEGTVVKSVMDVNGIANTATGRAITNDAQTITNTGKYSVTNQVSDNKVLVDTNQVKSAFGDTIYTTWDANGITNITENNTVTSDNDGTTFANEGAKTPFEEGGKTGTRVNTKITGNKVETGKVLTDFAEVANNLDVGGDLNVAGNIETHDAVLSADSRQVVTGRQLYQTNERVDRLDNRIKKVGANAAALAALRPSDFNPDDKFSIAAGFGSYRNANAAALGLFYRPNENVLLSLGTSFGDEENMVNAGVSVKFGRGKSMAERRKEMADEVSSMRDEMRSQDERIAELEEMLKKQSELIEKLSKES